MEIGFLCRAGPCLSYVTRTSGPQSPSFAVSTIVHEQMKRLADEPKIYRHSSRHREAEVAIARKTSNFRQTSVDVGLKFIIEVVLTIIELVY